MTDSSTARPEKAARPAIFQRTVRLPGWWPLAVIIVLGWLVRLACVYAASGLPFFTVHRLDVAVYHQAGLAIAGGDWALGSEVLHMSPGYSYWVGTIYSLLGSGPWPVRLANTVLGIGTVLSVHGGASLLLASRRWALAAAAVAAFYGPFLFFETHILATSLAVFAHALGLFLLLRAVRGERLREWLLFGLVWGVAVVVRPTALLWAGPVAAVLWWIRGRLGTRGALASGAVALVAAACVIAPISIRNLVVGGELVLVTDSGGLNFYIGNGPGALGSFRVPEEAPGATNAGTQWAAFRQFAEAQTGRDMAPAEVERFLYQRSFEEIRRDPLGWIGLLARKVRFFWSARELPNNHDYGFHRRINPVLSLPWVQFSWLAPLAMLGVVLMCWPGRGQSREDRAAQLAVALFILVQLAALVAFFVVARYRAPAVPVVILASLFAARAIVRWLSERDWRRLSLAGAGVVAAAVVVFWPTLPLPMDNEYFQLGYAYQVQGNLEDAETAYRDAIAINPRHLSAHKNLAQLYSASGDADLAQQQWIQVGVLGRALGEEAYVRQAERALATWGMTLPED